MKKSKISLILLMGGIGNRFSSSLPKQFHNLSGKKIGAIDSGLKTKGFHTVKFNAGQMASGVYFYRLKTSHFQRIRKMILIK